MLYNVPARTGLNMLPETCERLAHHPGMIGVKEAADDLGQLARLTALTPLPVYCGSDQWMAPALRLGARGVISVLSNLCPEAVRILCQSQQKGCEQSAAAQQRHLAALTDALLTVWEGSVRATPLFLPEAEIRRIRGGVPQAITAVERLTVAADDDGAPVACGRLAALDAGQYAGGCDPAVLDAQLRELLLDERRRAVLPERELGMRMQVTPKFDRIHFFN